MPQVAFRLRQVLRQMWFLPALFSALAVAAVVIARLSAFLVPEELPFEISQEAIENILGVIASSMLTVATFALATMVSVFSFASQGTSPRAVRLIVEDRAAQTSISAFLGAFLFSVVGIVALSSGFYSEAGRLILFAATLLVIVVVVGALIRWIDKISFIGRVGNTIDRVEHAATAAFLAIGRKPLYGCRAQKSLPKGGALIHSDRIGHVQHFDPARLQQLAEERSLAIHVNARPGAYVTPMRPLAIAEGDMDEEAMRCICDAFVVGDERTFDEDPRFGLIVLNEIACRALSPAVNDPGTAIDVVETIVRILDRWVACRDETNGEVKYPNVTVPSISADDVITDAFRPIARDGAGTVELCLRLIAGLHAVRTVSPNFLGPAAFQMVQEVAERARSSMSFPADVSAVSSAAAGSHGSGSGSLGDPRTG